MSLESVLAPVLQAVCPRTWSDFAASVKTRPFVTFQQIGGQVINPLNNEMPGLRNATVQINVWADTRDEARALMNQIEDAMRAAPGFTAQPLSAAFNDYDSDMLVYGSQQDFSIWL